MKRNQEHFGLWLRQQIEELLLTQEAFAEQCGVPFWTLRNWIKRPSPSIRGANIVRLARGLGVPREEIESHLAGQRGAAA